MRVTLAEARQVAILHAEAARKQERELEMAYEQLRQEPLPDPQLSPKQKAIVKDIEEIKYRLKELEDWRKEISIMLEQRQQHRT